MNIQYIYHKIRKKTLISAIIPVVFLVFLIFMAYNFPFKEVFSPITYSNVSKLDTAFTSRKDYVSLSDITLYYTGYDSVKNSQVVGKYFYAIENNKCYFFLLNSEKALESDTFITFEHLKLQLSSPDLNYNNLLTNLSEDINWQYTHMAEVSPQYVAVEYRGMLTYSYIFALLLTFMGIYTLVILLIHIVTFICPQLEKGLFPKTPFQQKKQLFQKLDWELSEANSFNSFIPFGLGVVVGIFAIAKIVEIIFQKFPLVAYWAIIGLIIASPFAILISAGFKGVKIVSILTGVVALAIGAFMGNKLGGDETPQEDAENVAETV